MRRALKIMSQSFLSKRGHMINVIFRAAHPLSLCLFVAIAVVNPMHAQDQSRPRGFLWYSLPQDPPVKSKRPQGVRFSHLSYTQRDAILKFYTLEALHKVRFTHKLEDEKNFLALQNFWLKEAQIHGQLNQKALMAYPEYDYSVTHPTSNIGIKIQDAIAHEKKNKALHALAKNHGFVFYYRGKSSLDTRQIPILQAFCKEHGFHMVGVSVDGEVADTLPESRIERGDAEAMNVHYFPAILLVNPKSKQVIPVAYGLTTQDVLVDHLWSVHQNFNGVFNE